MSDSINREWAKVEFKQLPPELMPLVNDRDEASNALQMTRDVLNTLEWNRQSMIQELNALDTRIIQERQVEEGQEHKLDALEEQISRVLVNHLGTQHFSIELYDQGDEQDVPF